MSEITLLLSSFQFTLLTLISIGVNLLRNKFKDQLFHWIQAALKMFKNLDAAIWNRTYLRIWVLENGRVNWHFLLDHANGENRIAASWFPLDIFPIKSYSISVVTNSKLGYFYW